MVMDGWWTMALATSIFFMSSLFSKDNIYEIFQIKIGQLWLEHSRRVHFSSIQDFFFVPHKAPKPPENYQQYNIPVLWWTGGLSGVYPAFYPMTAGIGFSPPRDPELGKWKKMDGKWTAGLFFKLSSLFKMFDKRHQKPLSSNIWLYGRN